MRDGAASLAVFSRTGASGGVVSSTRSAREGREAVPSTVARTDRALRPSASGTSSLQYPLVGSACALPTGLVSLVTDIAAPGAAVPCSTAGVEASVALAVRITGGATASCASASSAARGAASAAAASSNSAVWPCSRRPAAASQGVPGPRLIHDPPPHHYSRVILALRATVLAPARALYKQYFRPGLRDAAARAAPRGQAGRFRPHPRAPAATSWACRGATWAWRRFRPRPRHPPLPRPARAPDSSNLARAPVE